MTDQPVPFVYATDVCGAETSDGNYSCELDVGHEDQHMDGTYRWTSAAGQENL